MSRIPPQVRNIIALMIAQAVAAGVGIFAFTLTSRVIPVTELGRFGFVSSSTVIFGLLAELGMRYVAIKDIAIDQSQSRIVFRHAIILRLVLSAGVMALLYLVSEVFPPWQNETRLLMLAGLGTVSQFGPDPVSWIFFGQGRVDLGAVLLIIDRILYVIAVNIAALVFHTAEALVIAVLVANLLRTLIGWLWVRRSLPPPETRSGWDRELFRKLIVNGLSIGAAVVVAVSYMQISVVVAQSVVSASDLGFYAVGNGFINLCLIVPMAITNALFPSLAALASNPIAAAKLNTRMIKLNLLLVVPLGLITFVFARPLLSLWVGSMYADAAPLLRVLSIGMIASAMNYLYRVFFFAINRPTFETIVDGVALILMIILGELAGSRYGGMGIGVVYTVLEIALLISKISLMSFINVKPTRFTPQPVALAGSSASSEIST